MNCSEWRLNNEIRTGRRINQVDVIMLEPNLCRAKQKLNQGGFTAIDNRGLQRLAEIAGKTELSDAIKRQVTGSY